MDYPVAGRQINEVGQHARRRSGIDLQHGGLLDIDPGGQFDDAGRREYLRRDPIVAGQVDHQVTNSDTADRAPEGADPSHALGANPARGNRAGGIAALDLQDIRRINRTGEHVDRDLARPRRADIWNFDTMNDLFGGTDGGEFGDLHRAGSWFLPE